MAPEVMQTLLDRVPPFQPAQLRGAFRRHPVRHQLFPGLVRASDDETTISQQQQPVQGVLYRNLSVNEMKRLDWFEGDEYEKIACHVDVMIDDNGSNGSDAPVATHVYLWTNPVTELDLTQPWSYQRFRQHHLEAYLERTVRPCRQELDRIGMY